MLSRSFQQSFSWLLGCTCRIESIRGDGAAAGNATSEASFSFPGHNCSRFFPSSVPGNPTLPPPLGIYRTYTTLWSYLCDLTCSRLSAPPIQIFSHVVRGGVGGAGTSGKCQARIETASSSCHSRPRSLYQPFMSQKSGFAQLHLGPAAAFWTVVLKGFPGCSRAAGGDCFASANPLSCLFFLFPLCLSVFSFLSLLFLLFLYQVSPCWT